MSLTAEIPPHPVSGDLSVTTHLERYGLTLRIRGPVVRDTRSALTEHLDSALRRVRPGEVVRCDLHECTRLDGAAVEALADLQQQAQFADVTFHLFRVPARLRSVVAAHPRGIGLIDHPWV